MANVIIATSSVVQAVRLWEIVCSQFSYFQEGSRASTQSFLGMECICNLKKHIINIA